MEETQATELTAEEAFALAQKALDSAKSAISQLNEALILLKDSHIIMSYELKDNVFNASFFQQIA